MNDQPKLDPTREWRLLMEDIQTLMGRTSSKAATAVVRNAAFAFREALVNAQQTERESDA